MSTNFLLRFQERYLWSEQRMDLRSATTNTKVKGESADRQALATLPFALASATATRIRGEQPDHCGALCATALPNQEDVAAKETLTFTFVHSEAPRNDDNRRIAGRVFPPCF